jgi:hypothetical protein
MYPNFTLLWFVQALPFTIPYPFISHLPFSTAFSTHPYNLYLHRCYVLYYWCLMILFFFPSFPKFHRVVPLLQTCSTFEFINDHAFFVYMLIFWMYLPYMKENIWFLFFWDWITSLNMMSSNCIHLSSNHVIILYG